MVFMEEQTITYELIRKIQREEQRQPKLTPVPENFFEAVAKYLQQKKQLTLKDDRKVTLEIKNIERLVEDIFNRRERKILNASIIAARTGMMPENLTSEEKAFFDEITNILKKRRGEMLEKTLKEKELAPMIVFKVDVPAFVGIDGNTYGPFKSGDIARIPEENMKVFVEKGMAEEFKVSV
jgi:DNA replication initiation complex subunit (GINS family)